MTDKTIILNDEQLETLLFSLDTAKEAMHDLHTANAAEDAEPTKTREQSADRMRKIIKLTEHVKK